MHQNGFINAAEFATATEAPLGLVAGPRESNDWPYFLALVNDELQGRLPKSAEPIPYQVYTTLDPDLQNAATEAVRLGMEKVDALVKRHKMRRACSRRWRWWRSIPTRAR